MLKIIGRTSSSNVQKVLWTCAELGLAYDRQDAGLKFGVVDTPEFFALNPNRRVPVIVDDGFVLWESNSIVRYLADVYGKGELAPADRKLRADAERWMDWQLANVAPALGPLFMGLVRTPPEKRDMAAIARSRDATEANMEILDAQLASRRYLTGDALSFGDIAVGPFVHRWFAFEGIERKPLAHLDRWYKLLLERPGYREFVAVKME